VAVVPTENVLFYAVCLADRPRHVAHLPHAPNATVVVPTLLPDVAVSARRVRA